MNEERLQVIEERRKHANGMNITNAVHDSDACTHADYTFVEWALEDVSALIAEVRSLNAMLDAVPVAAIGTLFEAYGREGYMFGYLPERNAIAAWLAQHEPQMTQEPQP